METTFGYLNVFFSRILSKAPHLSICRRLGGESIHQNWPKTLDSTDVLFRMTQFSYPHHMKCFIRSISSYACPAVTFALSLSPYQWYGLSESVMIRRGPRLTPKASGLVKLTTQYSLQITRSIYM